MRRFGNAIQQYYGQLIVTTIVGANAILVNDTGANGINVLAWSNTAGSGLLDLTNTGTTRFRSSGQTQFLTNSIARMTIAANGPVSILNPTSGVPLTVNTTGLGSGATVQISSGAVADCPNIVMGRNAVNEATVGVAATNYVILTGATVGDLAFRGGAAGIAFGTGTTMFGRMASGGSLSLSPNSGVALTVNSVATQVGLQINPGDSASVGMQISDPGTNNTAIRLNTTNTGTLLQSLGTSTSFVLGMQLGAALTVAPDRGLFMQGATGSSQGLGTINATGLFINGTAVTTTAPLVAIKSALTARASNTTLSNDPDLVIAIPGAGTYDIELVGTIYNTLSATVGAQMNFNYSGTFTANSSVISNVTGPGVSGIGGLITSTVTTAVISGNCGVTIGGGNTYLKATLVATGAGNLGFAWAQNNSNATATNVGAGTRMVVTKIA
jgi:hypothetical protein